MAMNRSNSVDRLGLPYGLPWVSTGKRGSEGGQVKIKLALGEKNLNFEWRGSWLRTGLQPIGLTVKKLQSRANNTGTAYIASLIVQVLCTNLSTTYKVKNNKHR